MSAPRQTWDDFERAHVRITLATGPVGFRPATRRSGEFPAELAEGPVHVITAWNPGGEKRDAARNDASQRELSAEIDRRQLARWPAVGLDPDSDWYEDSIAVVGLSRDEACALGRQFGQVAIFELVDAPDGLLVVACDGRVATAHSWAIDPAPA
ncbi:MAG TPA: DUF3293 domain-containing protein [Acidimicrobiales bacterium]|jgi:hypothetical protein|nr:DUF3293 domain-containing protein [Acidimicrobiales bacterium]